MPTGLLPYIIVEDTSFPVETAEEIQAARDEMISFGLAEATIWLTSHSRDWLDANTIDPNATDSGEKLKAS